MTIGDKIKRIRTFRNMTQAELGAALGWGDKGANRLAQYETNYRVPKQDLITEMAKILDVNPWTLYDATEMNASEFMELLFWIDEFNPSAINLFQMETYPGEKCNSSEDTTVRYHDNDSWPAHPPIGLWINYGLVNDFMKEWGIRKEELKSGQITKDEYFEWKINWPMTCDDCGKHEPMKQWRSANTELSET
jgi:transcriptional regulator with XRE-family HTH domain